MPSLDLSPTAAAQFRGEPGEQSPDATGGWDASGAREYREFALRQEAREFADLYGWDALLIQIAAARTGEDH